MPKNVKLVAFPSGVNYIKNDNYIIEEVSLQSKLKNSKIYEIMNFSDASSAYTTANHINSNI
jgi:hypothetical protein